MYSQHKSFTTALVFVSFPANSLYKLASVLTAGDLFICERTKCVVSTKMCEKRERAVCACERETERESERATVPVKVNASNLIVMLVHSTNATRVDTIGESNVWHRNRKRAQRVLARSHRASVWAKVCAQVFGAVPNRHVCALAVPVYLDLKLGAVVNGSH